MMLGNAALTSSRWLDTWRTASMLVSDTVRRPFRFLWARRGGWSRSTVGHLALWTPWFVRDPNNTAHSERLGEPKFSKINYRTELDVLLFFCLFVCMVRVCFSVSVSANAQRSHACDVITLRGFFVVYLNRPPVGAFSVVVMVTTNTPQHTFECHCLPDYDLLQLLLLFILAVIPRLFFPLTFFLSYYYCTKCLFFFLPTTSTTVACATCVRLLRVFF